jgi:D-xylose transport system substrate-binding protein
MYRKTKLIACLAACVSLALVGGGLHADSVVKVGASFPGGNSRWTTEAQAMREAASGSGVELTVDQTAMVSSAQIEYFKARVSGGDKVILVTAIDGLDANWPAALRSAKGAGVTVIAYDRGLSGADLYYSFDIVEIGRMQGRWLVGKVPAGDYFLLRGADTDANSALFANGALEIIGAAGQVKLLNPLASDQTVSNWNPYNAQMMVSAMLKSAVPAAILAPNDGTAGGAAAAIMSSSIPGPSKVSLLGALTGQDGGLDALKRIYYKKQGMTIIKDVRVLARRSISLAASLGRGSPVASVATGAVDGTPSLLVTPAIDPDAVFAVDAANLKAKAEAGLLGYAWSQIVGP